MKIYQLLVNLLIMITFSTCTVTTDSSSVLKQAEQCMNSRPDSALLLLQNISHPEKLSHNEYATWCLLITQAEDKEGIEHISDSLINIAVQYFDKRHNELRKAQVYYCRGRVLMDMSLFDQAMASFLKAEHYVQKTTNYDLYARICNHIGDLYRKNSLYDRSLIYYKRANSYYKQIGHIKGIAYTLRDIGLAFENIGQLDSSFFYLDQSLCMAEENEWGGLKQHVLKCLGNVHESLSAYPMAIDCVYSSMEFAQNDNQLNSLFYSLGYLYAKIGQKDSALFYLNKSISSSDINIQCQSYREYSLLSYLNKNYEVAFDANERYLLLRDSIEQIYHSEKIAEIVARYNYEKAINEKSQLLLKKKSNEYSFLLTIIGLLTVLIIVVYLSQNLLRKKQLELQSKEQALMLNNQRLNDSLSEIKKSKTSLLQKECELQNKVNELQENLKIIHAMKVDKHQIETAYSQKNEELNRDIAILQGEIREKMFYIKKMKQKSTKFVRKYFEQDCPQMKKLYHKSDIVTEYSDSEWEVFETKFNYVYPDYIDKLNKKFPKITENEKRYCCLFILGIKADKISAVLGLESNTVSKYRKGILKKNNQQDKETSFEDILNNML